MKTFRNLLIWQKAMALTTDIYQLTNHFPKEELFGLISQMRRSAVSIPFNLAERYVRSGNKEFQRFVIIARSSLFELQTQIEIARNIKYLNKEEYLILNEKSRELDAMVSGFLKKICVSDQD